ncbi:o-succinylbenzoate--CoA ligase [Microbacterium sediminicola]|uniref:O-succinylbenzoate--CoA ligase n=1 Tax=Microbacterium sediminicola TaxID=415210 RepID=A0ABP4U9Z3_9MICO
MTEVLPGLGTACAGTGPPLWLGGEPERTAVLPAGTAAVVTTSGSTGYPKSVVLSAAALRASAEATAARIGEGSWVLALEPSYVAGLQVLVRSILAGTTPTVVPPSFAPSEFADAAARIPAPRYTSLVPAQVVRLLDAADHDGGVAQALRSFEAILVGGQALPPAVAERAQAAGARIVRTYGSSETSGGCVYDGVPLDGVSVRVVDGEVHLAGPMLASGYLDGDVRAAETFVTDGDGRRWYRTGDAGSFDGTLRITGRRDNVIVSGGVNISLDRVERAVRTVPGLEQAVVVPVLDERWGQASMIVVAEADLGAGPDVDVRAVSARFADARAAARAAVAAELGPPARPRGIRALDTIPLLPSGKPDRRALAALLARDAGS